jgi:4-alpha-glucanotransferase
VQAAARIRRELTALLGNVCLLRDDRDPNVFYPRFQLMVTPSFAALDPERHAPLRDFHDRYFYSDHDALWSARAKETLPALMRSNDMLICGEDLGFVPACVPGVMHELGIVGLRIQRMPGSESPEGARSSSGAVAAQQTVLPAHCNSAPPMLLQHACCPCAQVAVGCSDSHLQMSTV